MCYIMFLLSGKQCLIYYDKRLMNLSYRKRMSALACCTCFLLALQKGSCFIVIKLLYLILLVALMCNSNLETAG